MSTIIPITLTQGNLGQRHHQLNTLVKEAYDNRVPFESIQHLIEKSPIDRLFKIDYASKLRNLDYILQNIRDEDMLYVSRALKCKWLLDTEFQDIICPRYLEDVLYPNMVTTAVSKMRNWLYLHLKDPERCENFYMFYCKTKFDYAMKFLSLCSSSFILNETSNIIEKLSPHYFKRLCKSCPRIAKIYFDSMPENYTINSSFLNNQYAFHNSLKFVLKQEPEMFFDITEKYYNIKFSRSQTKYIVNHHKDKFKNKVELYSSSLLDTKTMADCLNQDECKEIVLKLAQAKYLEYWFSYKNIEPLIKRLSIDERSAFKKRVFVDKDIGGMVEEWPYKIPTLPTQEYLEDHIFLDLKSKSFDYDDDFNDNCLRTEACNFLSDCGYSRCVRPKTYLDKLFDEYRFVSFKKSMFELSRRIKVESSLQNREYILLVLVSKCGGRAENLASLLALLAQHTNEPVHLRSAVVRSLVKRAAVWRLPQDTWEALLQFARGLGLDGNTPEADCREGLHAVVLRSLLITGDCEQTVRDAFLREFSDFKEYSINLDEKDILSTRLPALILTAAEAEPNPEKKAHYLTLLLDTLQKYKINVETTTLIPTVSSLAKSDASAAKSLLQQLFDLNIARRTLFHENFQLIQNDASYVNALRHDISVIDINKFVDLAEKGEQRMEQFLRKITIYFTEKFGLFDCCSNEIRRRVLEKPDVKLTIARSLCILQGADFGFIREINSNSKHGAQLSAAMRANMHAGRPQLDMTGIDLSIVGAKGCANKVLVCPKTQVDIYVKDLLKWKRTVRIAIVLAERTGKEAEAFATAVTMRPTATLKAAIKYFRRRGDSFDPRVWESIKGTLPSIDYASAERKRLRDIISNAEYIPQTIRGEYCTILYSILKKDYPRETIQLLEHIENDISNVKEDFIEEIILEFLDKLYTDDENSKVHAICLYFRVLVKYLLVAKTESIQNARLATLCDPFLNGLQKLLKKPDNNFMIIFEDVLRSLQLNKVFFDVTYVSPLPVIEKILSWMRVHLPIEQHFNKYVYIHLTMLYYKAVRQGLVQKSDIFSDEKLKMKDGIDVVGHLFGLYIAREVKELISKYFESIVEIYRHGITEYFNKYYTYGESKTRYVLAVVKGILEGAVGTEAKIAVYLIRNALFSIDVKTKFEIIEKIKNSDNVESTFFAYNELFD